MTRNPDVPDRWPAPQPQEPGEGGQIPGSPAFPKSTRSGKRVGKTRGKKQDLGQHQQSPEPSPNAPDSSPPTRQPSGRLGFLASWPFWALVTVFVSGSMGFAAVALLFKLPAVPNCPATFWPTASASLRLYCAQLAANKQTAKNLLEAIALVNSLPKDHALRPEINRSIEQWSLEILKLGEQEFQAGKLKEAIALARQIPTGVPAYNLVEKRISRWQSIWSEGEAVYQKGIEELHRSNWHKAFIEAVHLTRLGNNYWARNRYEDLVAQIQTAREESAKLDKAYKLAKTEELNSLLEAIKLAGGISPNSYAYKEAQDLIADCGNKLIALARERLDKRDWQGVIQIANKIPASVNVQPAFQDLTDLAKAQSKAEQGNVASLEEAIALAQRLDPGRPLYDKAQDLIARWQREVEGVAHIARARDLAKPGTVNDLMAAIAEAQLVKSENPRFEEAKTQINRWIGQIETLQDRPYLERADQLAGVGDVGSLQDAIEQARQIVKGRSLHPEAQNKIGQWSGKIQRLQDQPFIDQAQILADSGNLATAVATAQQIKPERILYREAQAKIQSWKSQIERQEDQPFLDQASVLADSGNLSNAIDSAQQVKPGRVLYQEAQSKIRSWRLQMERQEDQPYLEQATALANSGNLSGAVASAQQVKPGRVLYQEAQSKIRSWRLQMERQEDQPYLEQATALANSGNLSGAVASAQQIKSGRALSGEARSKIRVWQRELQAQQQLQSALDTAAPGTPEALASAIRVARQIPRSSSVGSMAKEARNRWSYQLLALAQERSQSNITEAIAIAKTVPSGTEAYESAQLQIQAWQRSLDPTPSPLPTY